MLFELTLFYIDGHFNVDDCGRFYVETTFFSNVILRRRFVDPICVFNLNSMSDRRRTSTSNRRNFARWELIDGLIDN